MASPTLHAKFWYDNHWVIFTLGVDSYQNIITFLEINGLFFLAEMQLNFDTIPLALHGKGNSNNLLDYLANNVDDRKFMGITTCSWTF